MRQLERFGDTQLGDGFGPTFGVRNFRGPGRYTLGFRV